MEDELKLLLRRNLDGYKGYSKASESIKNDNFRNFLKTYASQRKKYADEIKSELEKRHISGGEHTSILGDLHQAFVNLKDSVAGINDRFILEECARGENQAVSDYEHVLKSNQLPPDLQKMVMRQHDKIRAAASTMQNLAGVV